jgi:hypothetical protein
MADTTRVEPSDQTDPRGVLDPGASHMLVVESPAPVSLTEHKQVGRHMRYRPAAGRVTDL